MYRALCEGICASVGNKRGFSVVNARCNHEVYVKNVLLMPSGAHLSTISPPSNLQTLLITCLRLQFETALHPHKTYSALSLDYITIFDKLHKVCNNIRHMFQK